MKRTYSNLEREAFKAGWQAAAEYAEYALRTYEDREQPKEDRLMLEMDTGSRAWEHAYKEWSETR